MHLSEDNTNLLSVEKVSLDVAKLVLVYANYKNGPITAKLRLEVQMDGWFFNLNFGEFQATLTQKYKRITTVPTFPYICSHYQKYIEESLRLSIITFMEEKNVINVSSGESTATPLEIQSEKESPDNIFQQILWFYKKLWYYCEISYVGTIFGVKEKLKEHITFSEISNRSMDVVVLSGGTKGIGVEVLRRLLRADMHVFVGCRNVVAGNEVLKGMRESGVTMGKAEFLPLDLSSLASVRQFAKNILNRETRINILINNAGVMFSPFCLTMDGFEYQFQVNYLGHFLLTMLLLPRLTYSASENKFGRIVNVSSCASYSGKIDFSDLDMKKHFSTHKSYGNSKLMQVISSNYLNARLQDQDAKIHAYSVHPGVINTDLYENLIGFKYFKWIFAYVMKTPDQAADGVSYAALSPEIEKLGGLFLWNCQQIRQPLEATEPAIQEQLWNTSLELCSIDGQKIHNSMKKETVTMVDIN